MIKNHIQQPDNSSLCGQSCVAMYCGVSLEESIKAFNSVGGTRTRQVIEIINKLGKKIDYRPLQRIKKGTILPRVAILKIVWKGVKNRSHWVLKYEDKIHDPSYSIPCPESEVYFAWVNQHGTVTSYMELE